MVSAAARLPSTIEQNVLGIIGQMCVRDILEGLDSGDAEAINLGDAEVAMQKLPI